MSLDEYIKIDNNFNSSVFISKVNNMLKRIYTSITINKLDDVIQFISDDVYDNLKMKIDNNTNNNKKVVYDEINSTTDIVSIKVDEYYSYITVRSVIKCLKYYLSLDTGEVVFGDDSNRVSITRNVVLKKKNNSIESNVYRCLGCGVSLDLRNSYTCPNCGRVFDLDEYDFIIDSIN